MNWELVVQLGGGDEVGLLWRCVLGFCIFGDS